MSKCWNDGCGRDGMSLNEDNAHAMTCKYRKAEVYCGCYACEGHIVGKAVARENEKSAAFMLSCARYFDADCPDIDPCDVAEAFVVAGRCMENVRR